MLLLALLAALLLGVLAAVFAYFRHGVLVPGAVSRKDSSPLYIIAGPSGVGKTQYYSYLLTGSVQDTVTSQEINLSSAFRVPLGLPDVQQSIRLVDCPGHLKLRPRTIETILQNSNIKGLVFMVDATANPKVLADTATFLYDILRATERRPGGVDILIACNRSESFSARPPFKIRELLEREIQTLRDTRAQGLAAVGVSGESEETEEAEDVFEIGTGAGARFEFTQLEGNVDVIPGSVGKKIFQQWDNWIDHRFLN